MPKRIVIDPVTRIEGHAKISIHLDDDGHVAEAVFHVAEFRGFERFCVGRPFWEMPDLTARICGICPVSHLLASAKTGDAILAVNLPPAAAKLRRLMNLGQIIQSHALSFFHLSSPDFLLGWDAPPASRNVFGLMASYPDLARAGIRLRQFGQEIIERLGGRKIHPAWAVPGGVRSGLTDDDRYALRARIPEALETTRLALGLFQDYLRKNPSESQIFGNFPTLFLGLVAEDETWEHYDGKLRFADSNGNVLVDEFHPLRYAEYIAEAVQPSSYLKSPYFRTLGFPEGIYRVGPLARLNLCSSMGTPLADQELTVFRQLGYAACASSFLYHYARLIEILGSLERVEALMDDPDLGSKRLRANAGINQLEAVGVSEAPRGTLFHHYHVDEKGLVQKVNLIIATGHNNLAMNRTVTQIARHYLRGPVIPEPLLNRVEAGIRAYDPCLSCSTHALGKMPLELLLFDADGTLLDRASRD